MHQELQVPSSQLTHSLCCNWVILSHIQGLFTFVGLSEVLVRPVLHLLLQVDPATHWLLSAAGSELLQRQNCAQITMPHPHLSGLFLGELVSVCFSAPGTQTTPP